VLRFDKRVSSSPCDKARDPFLGWRQCQCVHQFGGVVTLPDATKVGDVIYYGKWSVHTGDSREDL
jgi:hypothetical protein